MKQFPQAGLEVESIFVSDQCLWARKATGKERRNSPEYLVVALKNYKKKKNHIYRDVQKS